MVSAVITSKPARRAAVAVIGAMVGQNREVVFSTAPYGHFGSKDLTGYYQWRMVKFHATN